MSHIKLMFKGIRGRLLGMAIVPIFFAVITGVVALKGGMSLTAKVESIVTDSFPTEGSLGEMRAQLYSAGQSLGAAYSQLGEGGDGAKRKTTLDETKEAMGAFDSEMKQLDSMGLAVDALDALRQVQTLWPSHVNLVNQAVGLIESGKTGREAADAYQSVHESAKKLNDKINLVRSLSAKDLQKGVIETGKVAMQSKSLTIFVIILGSLFNLLIGFVVAHRLSKSLFNISTGLFEAGSQVSTGSSQLANASQQLATGAVQATTSISQTTQRIAEMAAQVEGSSGAARQAASAALQSRTAAEKGDGEIKNFIQSINKISGNAKKIQEITGVIDDISFQTNLLALNAAVEAARAGEQGKGFAVVADAVRSLAQKSAHAAKEITTLIRESVADAEAGAKMGVNSGKVLNEIVLATKTTSDSIQKIAEAAELQSKGMRDLNLAMTELDQLTQAHAQASEQISASVDSMFQQSHSVHSQVKDLERVLAGSSQDKQEEQSQAA